MRLQIFAIGRMKKGAEQELVERYIERLRKAAPALGFQSVTVQEQVESRLATPSLRMEEEGEKLLSALGDNDRLMVLDERGKSLSSPDFAQKIGAWRDDGVGSLILALGGPDGHSDMVRRRADLLLSFGAMTWPHQIARILAAEQLYRAITILSGHPYHRE